MLVGCTLVAAAEIRRGSNLSPFLAELNRAVGASDPPRRVSSPGRDFGGADCGHRYDHHRLNSTPGLNPTPA